ncbi:microsomal glutathione S-transferase 1-like [Clavelina lepadiformis]|uniref:microsomal glutathione S-transferase 1-like n=1 Tax=Clavelina lepadiformis TaxID=159417 RepID=UPI004041EED2
MSNLYTLENEVFSALIFYGTLVLIKTLLMAIWTSYYRTKHLSVWSREDAVMFAPNDPAKQKAMMAASHPQVERVRRAHLNDLENVVPFVVMALLYVGINPPAATALWHFRIFFAARAFHSLIYVNSVPQPFRGVAFLTGLAVTMSMAYQMIRAVY